MGCGHLRYNGVAFSERRIHIASAMRKKKLGETGFEEQPVAQDDLWGGGQQAPVGIGRAAVGRAYEQ